jgi:hypothetical protein
VSDDLKSDGTFIGIPHAFEGLLLLTQSHQCSQLIQSPRVAERFNAKDGVQTLAGDEGGENQINEEALIALAAPAGGALGGVVSEGSIATAKVIVVLLEAGEVFGHPDFGSVAQGGGHEESRSDTVEQGSGE